MKHEYKIKVDAPMPSEEQIARHKDFNHVLQEYQKLTQPIYRRPLYKNPKAFLGLVLIIVVAVLVFEAVEEEKKMKLDGLSAGLDSIPPAIVLAEENSFLQPAVAALAPARQEFELAPHKAATLRLADGTRLDVPADAFSYQDGSPSTGTVHINLRLLRDPLDHVLANLPLRTADGMLLEASGTFDISATEAGKPLRLQAGKTIKVTMPVKGQNGVEPMKVVPLDTLSRTWTIDTKSPDISAKNLPVKLSPKNDGFGVVEFGPDGKVLRRTEPSDSSATAHMVQEFELNGLGIQSVNRAFRPAEQKEIPVRWTSGGKALQLYSIYRISPGVNTAAFFWPARADFTYILRCAPEQAQVFFGFLADGRVAWTNAQALNALDSKNGQSADLQVQVSTQPMKNKAELMQLLGI